MIEKPKGELSIRVLAMPKDTNPSGDIFGGWLLSQMDIAGAVFCAKYVKGRVVTIAMDTIELRKPVYVGDTVCCYVSLVKIGNTSMTVLIEVWANREYEEDKRIKVTTGEFTYVKVNTEGKPEKIEKR